MPETQPAPDDTEMEPIPDTLPLPTLPTSMTAAREQLDDLLDALGADEVLVLTRIAERLTHGCGASATRTMTASTASTKRRPRPGSCRS